jgi:hypothetical protein
LSKNPDERYNSAREVAMALAAARAASPPSSQAPRSTTAVADDEMPTSIPTAKAAAQTPAPPTPDVATIEQREAAVPLAGSSASSNGQRAADTRASIAIPRSGKGGLPPARVALGGLVIASVSFAAYFIIGSPRGVQRAPVASAAPQLTPPPLETLAPASRLENPNSSIRLRLTTEGGKTTYSIGQKEQMRLVVTSNTSGYLYLVAFTADGTADCIFPNRASANNEIQSELPRKFTVPAAGAPSRDTVAAFVSTQPLMLCDKPRYAQEEVVRIAKSSSAEWQSAILAIETTP